MTAITPYRLDLLRRRLVAPGDRWRLTQDLCYRLEAVGFEHGDRVMAWARGVVSRRPLARKAHLVAPGPLGRDWSFVRVDPMGRTV